jgi:6-phosphogluconolactonase
VGNNDAIKKAIYPDVDSLVKSAAGIMINAARDAVHERGRFLLALSGGNSPRPLYKLLANKLYRDQLPWLHTFILWSDERFVPIDDELSNAGMAMDLLLNHMGIPEKRIFPMYYEGLGPEEAAVKYEKSLLSLLGDVKPRLDLTLLGCGEDGHTASLFPKSAALKEQSAIIRAVEKNKNGVSRITMTTRLLNQSRNILFIVYGKEKAKIVNKVLEGPARPEQFPAQAIKPVDGKIWWLLDEDAASLLEK